MSFAVHIERTNTGGIVISGIVNGETKEKWTVLDGPHLQHGYSWDTPYVYVRVGSTGRTERLHLTNTQANQIRTLQAR